MSEKVYLTHTGNTIRQIKAELNSNPNNQIDKNKEVIFSNWKKQMHIKQATTKYINNAFYYKIKSDAYESPKCILKVKHWIKEFSNNDLQMATWNVNQSKIRLDKIIPHLLNQRSNNNLPIVESFNGYTSAKQVESDFFSNKKSYEFSYVSSGNGAKYQLFFTIDAKAIN